MNDSKIRNMEEFSAASGISRPTVSKYFNDPSSVKPATRERIEKAILEFGYRPNKFAISLNRKKPKNIGVVVPHISDPFYTEIVRQIEILALQRGYWAIVLSSHAEPKLEENAFRTLLSLRLSGAVIAPLGYASDLTLIRHLRQTLPVVFLDARIADEAPFVGTDNAQSISLIVEYLCRTGEPPCYLDMPRVNRNAVERRETYVRAMTRLGLQPVVVETASESWDFEAIGYDETNRLLDADGFPSRTVLCANDRLALGVMAAAYARKLRVGRDRDCDLRVAGHDDHPLSRYACPALTTVAQNYSQMARTCVDVLLGMIDRPEGEDAAADGCGQALLEAKLIMRESA